MGEKGGRGGKGRVEERRGRNIERVRNNTHSHILLKIPKEYDRNYVLKLMSDFFKKLGDRFILFNEKAKNEFANVIYSTKKLGFYYEPEKLVII